MAKPTKRLPRARVARNLALERKLANEREACAKIAEAIAIEEEVEWDDENAAKAARAIADTIRRRGSPTLPAVERLRLIAVSAEL